MDGAHHVRWQQAIALGEARGQVAFGVLGLPHQIVDIGFARPLHAPRFDAGRFKLVRQFVGGRVAWLVAVIADRHPVGTARLQQFPMIGREAPDTVAPRHALKPVNVKAQGVNGRFAQEPFAPAVQPRRIPHARVFARQVKMRAGIAHRRGDTPSVNFTRPARRSSEPGTRRSRSDARGRSRAKCPGVAVFLLAVFLPSVVRAAAGRPACDWRNRA